MLWPGGDVHRRSSTPGSWRRPAAVRTTGGFTLLTVGFARWTTEMERIVLANPRPVPVAESGLGPNFAELLRGQQGQGPLLSTQQDTASAAGWLPNQLPEPRPRFAKRSQLFP